MTFIHLRVHTDYSLGYSCIKISDLVDYCKLHSIPAVCVADRYNLFGSLEFSMACIKSGIQPILGSIIKIEHDLGLNQKARGDLLLIAQNEEGYKNLLQLSSDSFLLSKGQDEPFVTFEHFKSYADGLIVLCGTQHAILQEMIGADKVDAAKDLIKSIADRVGGNLYIEIIREKEDTTSAIEEFLIDYAFDANIPIVGTNEVCFLAPEFYNAADALTCITNGRYLREDDRPRAGRDNYFKSYEQMAKRFADLPEAIENTALIAKKCTVLAKASDPMLPRFPTVGRTEEEELCKQSEYGLTTRIQHITDAETRKKYFDRLEYELSVINEMKFAGYFLIVSDFIKWSKAQDIPVGPGRGSGAGSIVAWSLEITDLDPIHFGLLFERFLNPERVSMPDFDIDFCQHRRDEVISYVKQKYGEDKVANIITFGKMQARAVLRDVGRVLEIPYKIVDLLCKMIPHNPANPITLKEAINLDKALKAERESDSAKGMMIRLAEDLEGVNRHVSTHAAGIVIADKPLVQILPLYMDPNTDSPVTQYTMKYAESAGLVKFDFLGLKTLTVISSVCKLINMTREEKFEISAVSLDDKTTYEMLSTGRTIGVFQFESAGMREAIKKLKPDHIDDLIALGSLYRPGPMDNIPSYIHRKHGLETVEYVHPALAEILQETYGIIVYQEQVIQIAQVLAGYSLGAADLLRRAMGKKIRSEMEVQREIFVKGAIANGVDKKQAIEIFNLVEKFASYGFNKSHAAAYAILSYQTAYLKANHPIEFFVASMNLEIHDTDKINLFAQDARLYGLTILPPDINKSSAFFAIEEGAIRYGLGAIKGAGIKLIEEVSALRECQPRKRFEDLKDLVQTCGKKLLNKRMMINLAKAGAFDNFTNNRREVAENVEGFLDYHGNNKDSSSSQGWLLDSIAEQEFQWVKAAPWNDKQILAAEFEALGFYLSSHPLKSYIKKLERKNITWSNEIDALSGTLSLRLAGVITARQIRSTSRGKFAFIQLSDPFGLLEVSIFDENILYQNENLLIVGTSVYIQVDYKSDHTGVKIVVTHIIPLEESVKNVQIKYRIYVKNKVEIQTLRGVISPQGSEIEICAQVDNGTVVFKNHQALYITEEEVSKLRKYHQMHIEEVTV
jgi:DNA polymerase-3 subunit alpha